jgi:ketosteroid isomerase-like protein
MKPAEVVERWLAAINRRDVAALSSLAAADFLFVDSLGNRLNGGMKMERAWQIYFAMCPDYWVRADCAIADADLFLLAGESGGTIDGVTWKTPAAWKAVVGKGLVREWRVFADNKPVYEILAKRS